MAQPGGLEPKLDAIYGGQSCHLVSANQSVRSNRHFVDVQPLEKPTKDLVDFKTRKADRFAWYSRVSDGTMEETVGKTSLRSDKGQGEGEEKGRGWGHGQDVHRRRACAWDCASDLPSFLSVVARHTKIAEKPAAPAHLNTAVTLSLSSNHDRWRACPY